MENNSNNNELLSTLKFCVFDLETTGGNHESDRIIEIGMVKIANLQIVDEKTFLIQPDIAIPDFIQKLTAITPQDVKNAPKIEEIIEDILAFMGDSILVAHNTSFDIPFFNAVLSRIGRPKLKNPSLCTNMMTKYMIPNLLNTNLNYMSKIFQIKHRKAHRALDDARATAELLLNYLHIFQQKGISKVNGLYYPRNKFELDRANFKNQAGASDQILQTLSTAQAPFIISLKGESGVILFSWPGNNSSNELRLIKTALTTEAWVSATIKLYGSTLEALINFSSSFSKLSQESRKKLIPELNAIHLGGRQPLADLIKEESEDKNAEKILFDVVGDFVITHHLVLDQLLVYPTYFLHPKGELVFRYPGHQKKFLQYVVSRMNRWMQPQGVKSAYPTTYRNFLWNYLLVNQSNKDEFLAGKRSEVKKSSDEFFKRLDHYLNINPNPNFFPSNHI